MPSSTTLFIEYLITPECNYTHFTYNTHLYRIEERTKISIEKNKREKIIRR
jgi:hypothetical protein